MNRNVAASSSREIHADLWLLADVYAKAVVVPEAGATPDASDVISFAKPRLAGYKRPTSVDFVTTLPRNASGKVLKKDLRAPYREGRERAIN